jgi:Fe-S-cluster containining protein
MMSEPWFKDGLRFKCTGCGACCTGSPGYVFVSPSDLKALISHFKMPEEEFYKIYIRMVDGQPALIDRPGSHDCVFLEKEKCSVYESRPIQCRTFPWWIHTIQTPENWKEAGVRCEGIEHPDAPIIPAIDIATQCTSYLDNLIEQNFEFDIK